MRLEVIYFRVLCLGSGINIIGMSFAGFFTGRGVTRPVMIIYIIAMLLNDPATVDKKIAQMEIRHEQRRRDIERYYKPDVVE